MRQQILPGTTLSVSRFTFGTAGLFNAGSRRRRASLLAGAYEQGFTHFDTAPLYGFGIAEGDLKPFLAAHPDATVTTKVGIYPPGGADQGSLGVLVRKATGRLLPALSRPIVDWSIARARSTLAGSLRRLGRERIDVYLLHEPDSALLDTEEWLRWLDDQRDRVLHFGVAANARGLAPFVPVTPLSALIQTFDSLEGREAESLLASKRPLQFTYGYLHSLRRGDSVNVPAVLRGALARNATGSVIVSTSKVERLAQYGNISAQADAAAYVATPRA
jgi:aryl-alcohol dehydrogenase-like predicted oxidoreductase